MDARDVLRWIAHRDVRKPLAVEQLPCRQGNIRTGEVEPGDANAEAAAFAELSKLQSTLKAKLAAERLSVLGQRDHDDGAPNPAATFELVPTATFLHPAIEVTLDGEVTLNDEATFDSERSIKEWLHYNGPTYSNLRFKPDEVLDLWPRFPDDRARESLDAQLVDGDEEAEADRPNLEPDLARSGMPGRPSAKYLCLDELKLRAERKELCGSAMAESRALYDWLRREHPTTNPGTPKTIENNIRSPYRELKAANPPK